MQHDTREQRRTLEVAGGTAGLLEHVATRDMVTAYCAQRADLRGYQRMLAAWCETARQPDTTSVIKRFLTAIDEIDDDTKAVLGVLTNALNAARRA